MTEEYRIIEAPTLDVLRTVAQRVSVFLHEIRKEHGILVDAESTAFYTKASAYTFDGEGVSVPALAPLVFATNEQETKDKIKLETDNYIANELEKSRAHITQLSNNEEGTTNV